MKRYALFSGDELLPGRWVRKTSSGRTPWPDAGVVPRRGPHHRDHRPEVRLTHRPRLDVVCSAFPTCPRLHPCTCTNPAHLWQWAPELQDYVRLDLIRD